MVEHGAVTLVPSLERDVVRLIVVWVCRIQEWTRVPS
jgi:hypothetical protein